MIKLRPYQLAAISNIHWEFTKSERQYIEMPTGSGKTVTFLSYAKKYHERILIVVPSKELLNQVYETALLFYERSQLSRQGNGFSEDPSQVHICIIHSIRGKYLEFISGQYFDLVIIDEAHHIQAQSYKRLIKSMAFAPKFLGVTATPDRLDGQMIKELLNECSYKITIEKMISQKFLSDIEGYIVKTNIDISDVDDHNGDFSLTQLYKKLSTESRNNIILNICKVDMKGRKTIIFCLNVAHSKEIAKSLNQIGISAKAIDGKMKSSERKIILDSFRNNEISCLCNCQLLTEGFDEPSINGVVLARPTRSRALFMQMIGRGLRIYPGKTECKIVDIVDNHRSLASFASVLEDGKHRHIERFKGISEIRDFVNQQFISSIETKIERVNFFNMNDLDTIEALPCMKEYIESNKLYYYGNLSFDESSFLIWHNELKKEYANGNH